MIHLFHGEDIENSRKELQNFKDKYSGQEIIVYDGKKVTLTQFKQATESNTLFGFKRLIIIENLFCKRFSAKSKELDEFLAMIGQVSADCEIIFWEEKKIKKTLLKLLPKEVDLAIFNPSRNIFAFVEAIKPGQQPTIFLKFELSLRNDSPEMVFAMLVRQFRYLIMVKDLGKKVTDLNPWQLSKFMKQAEFFTFPVLLNMYNRLLDIDIKIKTGVTPFILTKEIELFLMEV